MGLQVTDNYYEKVPEKVINVKDPTIIWDIPVITDQTITENWLDIVIHDKKRKDLPTDHYSHTRWFKHYHKINWKTKQLQSPRGPGQLDVASEGKNCASYNRSIKKN